MSDQKPMAEVVALPVPGSRAERVEALRSLLSAWWEPPEDLIDTLPKAGMQLRYLSHVWVSRAFSEIDLVEFIQPVIAWRSAEDAVFGLTYQLKNKGLQTQNGDYSAKYDCPLYQHTRALTILLDNLLLFYPLPSYQVF